MDKGWEIVKERLEGFHLTPPKCNIFVFVSKSQDVVEIAYKFSPWATRIWIVNFVGIFRTYGLH